jgi:hypothetical protein
MHFQIDTLENFVLIICSCLIWLNWKTLKSLSFVGKVFYAVVQS